MRLLTTKTRLRLEKIIDRLGKGEEVSLDERIQLKKYGAHIPFLARKVAHAIKQRESLEKDGLI